MRENGNHDRETGKHQYETDGPGPGDDQSPKRHGEWVHQHGLDGKRTVYQRGIFWFAKCL